MNIPDIRVGTGYDVHRLVEGRELRLCGVLIPHTLGLLGHSDADVAIHALCDALLGAVAAGDIGLHFPDSDPAYAGVDSRVLLRRTVEIVREAGYSLVNADLTIIAQAPRLRPHIEAMRESLAETIGTDIGRISVKATTTERLGFTGRGEGIAAQAAVLVCRTED